MNVTVQNWMNEVSNQFSYSVLQISFRETEDRKTVNVKTLTFEMISCITLNHWESYLKSRNRVSNSLLSLFSCSDKKGNYSTFAIFYNTLLLYNHLVWYLRACAGFFCVPLRKRCWECRQRMWWSLQQATWSLAIQGRRNEKNRNGWWCSKHPDDKQTN